jgi:PEP-CTERM motif
MRSLKTSAIVASLVASTSFVASTFAAPAIPWSTPSGSNSAFSWSGGGSDNGLFGSPTLVTPTGISFSPSGFKATAANGVAGQISDRLEFDLAVVQPASGPRKDFDKIHIREFGDLALTSAPGSYAAANVGGALFVTVLETIDGPVGPAGTTPGTVYGTNGGFAHYVTDSMGNPTDYQNFPGVIGGASFASITRLWDGTFLIDLPQGVTKVKVVLNNILQASAGMGSVATIEKKAVGVPVSIEIFQGDIPEPASLMVLGAAGALILKRRRA